MNHKYFRRIQFVEILYWTCDIMLDLWCTFVEQEIRVIYKLIYKFCVSPARNLRGFTFFPFLDNVC